MDYTNGLVQDCSNSLANALELLQSRTKPTYYMVSNSKWQIDVNTPWSGDMTWYPIHW